MKSASMFCSRYNIKEDVLLAVKKAVLQRIALEGQRKLAQKECLNSKQSSIPPQALSNTIWPPVIGT